MRVAAPSLLSVDSYNRDGAARIRRKSRCSFSIVGERLPQVPAPRRAANIARHHTSLRVCPGQSREDREVAGLLPGLCSPPGACTINVPHVHLAGDHGRRDLCRVNGGARGWPPLSGGTVNAIWCHLLEVHDTALGVLCPRFVVGVESPPVSSVYPYNRERETCPIPRTPACCRLVVRCVAYQRSGIVRAGTS